MARKWSQHVTGTSDALDLDRGAFTWKDPHKIALSLKDSALKSTRRKSNPYRSALSMLTFYVNRGGTNISASQKEVLNKAKTELRVAFDRN
jgi:hypothetical protein